MNHIYKSAYILFALSFFSNVYLFSKIPDIESFKKNKSFINMEQMILKGTPLEQLCKHLNLSNNKDIPLYEKTYQRSESDPIVLHTRLTAHNLSHCESFTEQEFINQRIKLFQDIDEAIKTIKTHKERLNAARFNMNIDNENKRDAKRTCDKMNPFICTEQQRQENYKQADHFLTQSFRANNVHLDELQSKLLELKARIEKEKYSEFYERVLNPHKIETRNALQRLAILTLSGKQLQANIEQRTNKSTDHSKELSYPNNTIFLDRGTRQLYSFIIESKKSFRKKSNAPVLDEFATDQQKYNKPSQFVSCIEIKNQTTKILECTPDVKKALDEELAIREKNRQS